jgi:hypothetical protein
LKALQILRQSAPGLDPVVQRHQREKGEHWTISWDLFSSLRLHKGNWAPPPTKLPGIGDGSYVRYDAKKTSAILADFKGRLAANSADLETRLHELNKWIRLQMACLR